MHHSSLLNSPKINYIFRVCVCQMRSGIQKPYDKVLIAFRKRLEAVCMLRGLNVVPKWCLHDIHFYLTTPDHK